MEQYISKSALVAKIESKKKYAQTLGDNAINSSMQQFYDGMKQACIDILSFIDTFKVKDIDLEKECSKYFEDNDLCVHDDYIKFAKHFYEFGLKTQKGE